MWSLTPIEPFILLSEVRNEQRQIRWRTVIKQLQSVLVFVILKYFRPRVSFKAEPAESLDCRLRVSTGAGQQDWSTCVTCYFFMLSVTWNMTSCRQREFLLERINVSVRDYHKHQKEVTAEKISSLNNNSTCVKVIQFHTFFQKKSYVHNHITFSSYYL